MRRDPYEVFQRFMEFTETSPLDCIFIANDRQAFRIPKHFLCQNRLLREFLNISQRDSVEIFLPDLSSTQVSSIVEFLTSGAINGDNEHKRSIVEILVKDFGFPSQMDFGDNFFTSPNEIACEMQDCGWVDSLSNQISHFLEHVHEEVQSAIEKVELNANIQCRHCRCSINYIGRGTDSLGIVRDHYMEHLDDLKKYLKTEFDFEEPQESGLEESEGEEKIIEGRTLQPGEDPGDEDEDLGDLFGPEDEEKEKTENSENEPPASRDDSHIDYSVFYGPDSPSHADQVPNQDPKITPLKISKKDLPKQKKRKRSGSNDFEDAKKPRKPRVKQPLDMRCNECAIMVTKKGRFKHLMPHIKVPHESKPYKVNEGYQCQHCSFVKKGEHHVREHTVKKHGYLNQHFRSKGGNSLDDMFTFEGIQQYGPTVFDGSIPLPRGNVDNVDTNNKAP